MSGNVLRLVTLSGVSIGEAFCKAFGGVETISVDLQLLQCWEASSAQTRRNQCSRHCSCRPRQTLM